VVAEAPVRFRPARGHQDSLGTAPATAVSARLAAARLAACSSPAWLPLLFPRVFFVFGRAASPGAVPAAAAPTGSSRSHPSGCSHAAAAAAAATPLP